MKDKDSEFEQLKTELIGQKEELEEPAKELEETREVCYQLFCTIVELPIEPPVIEHDECSSPKFGSSVCSRLASFLAELIIFCKIHVHTPLGKM